MVEESKSNSLNMKVLTAFCFDTLIAKLKKEELPKYPENLEDPAYPIFVTWTIGKEEDLRGCIGTFAGRKLS